MATLIPARLSRISHDTETVRPSRAFLARTVLMKNYRARALAHGVCAERLALAPSLVNALQPFLACQVFARGYLLRTKKRAIWVITRVLRHISLSGHFVCHHLLNFSSTYVSETHIAAWSKFCVARIFNH